MDDGFSMTEEANTLSLDVAEIKHAIHMGSRWPPNYKEENYILAATKEENRLRWRYICQVDFKLGGVISAYKTL